MGHENFDSKEDNKLSEVIKIICGFLFLIVAIFLEKKNLSLFLYLPLYFLSYAILSFDIIANSLNNLRNKVFLDENTLMIVATIGAAIIGKYSEAVFVILFYSIGELLQDIAEDRSKDRIKSLINIAPENARIKTENGYKTVEASSVEKGSILEIRAGEKIPVDGLVLSGNAYLDTSAISGESTPVFVKENAHVISGSIVNDSIITIKTSCAYKDSTVSKILKLVEENRETRAPIERIITTFAKIYTPVVLCMAVILAVIPSLITGEWSSWIYKSLSFLVISCPCALVLSVPLTFFAGLGSCAKKGILVKGANHLQTLAQSDCFVFDKTGTLTNGQMSVADLSVDNNEIISYIYAVESLSSHPIAKALCKYIKDNFSINKIQVSDFKEERGKGIIAKVNNIDIRCGNNNLINTEIAIPNDKTAVLFEIKGKFCGYALLEDKIKDNAKSMFLTLHELGKETYMLTGDKKEVADNVCRLTGCKNFYASLLPHEKVEKLKELQNKGLKCVFTGDGINDAPVMIASDTSISMGTIGSDSAIEASDIVILNDNLDSIPIAIQNAEKTISIAKQNLYFAVLFKALCLILVALGYASMTVAIIADTPVTLLCILNSLRALK